AVVVEGQRRRPDALADLLAERREAGQDRPRTETSPTWSVREPKIRGSKRTVDRPAFPDFGARARLAMWPAFCPAFSGVNRESFVAHAIPCPLDSRETRARMDRYRLAR